MYDAGAVALLCVLAVVFGMGVGGWLVMGLVQDATDPERK